MDLEKNERCSFALRNDGFVYRVCVRRFYKPLQIRVYTEQVVYSSFLYGRLEWKELNPYSARFLISEAKQLVAQCLMFCWSQIAWNRQM